MANIKWGPVHEEFLRANYGQMSDKELAERISRMGLKTTAERVKKKRQSMELGKDRGRRKGSKDSYKRVTTRDYYQKGRSPD